MNVEATLLSLAIGVVIPAVVALLAKAHASAGLKAFLSALLAAVAGGLNGALQALPHGWTQWEAIGWQVGLAWIMASVAYVSGWKPSGAAPAIARATSRFGFGPAEPTAAGATATSPPFQVAPTS